MALMSSLAIDHILFITRDLEQCKRRLRVDYGLDAVEGGAHPEWGTGNLIVPIGDQYIELFAVTDRLTAERHPVGRWLLDAVMRGEGPRAVCLRSRDFAADALRFGFTIEPGERVYSDGRCVRWLQAGVGEALATNRPFFMFDWPLESAELRLGLRPPKHDDEMAGISSVTIGSPVALPDLGPAVEIVPGDAYGLHRVILARTDGSTFDLAGAVL